MITVYDDTAPPPQVGQVWDHNGTFIFTIREVIKVQGDPDGIIVVGLWNRGDDHFVPYEDDIGDWPPMDLIDRPMALIKGPAAPWGPTALRPAWLLEMDRRRHENAKHRAMDKYGHDVARQLAVAFGLDPNTIDPNWRTNGPDLTALADYIKRNGVD